MPNYEESIVINRSFEGVFKTIADPKNATMMFANVAEVEVLNEKDLEAGAKYREYRQLTNRRVGTDIEIISYETPHRYSVRSSANGLNVVYDYTFKEKGPEETEVFFTGTLYPEKFVLKLTKPLLVKMLKREDKSHLLNVKKYMEEN